MDPPKQRRNGQSSSKVKRAPGTMQPDHTRPKYRNWNWAVSSHLCQYLPSNRTAWVQPIWRYWILDTARVRLCNHHHNERQTRWPLGVPDWAHKDQGIHLFPFFKTNAKIILYRINVVKKCITYVAKELPDRSSPGSIGSFPTARVIRRRNKSITVEK